MNPDPLVATHRIFIEAATHDGVCRCWKCLAWWATLDRTSSLAPFTAEEMNEYVRAGFSFTVTFPGGEMATGVMRENKIESDDPGLGDFREFDDLEREAYACGWILAHAYA